MNEIVIFDLDNTLVHSTIDFAAIRRDIIALWRKYSVTVQPDQELQQLSIGQIIALGESHDANAGTALGPTAWHIVLEYEKAGMHAATIEEGAVENLTVLRSSGYRLVVLTNNARPATMEALDKFQLRALFDLILTRDEVAMKPDSAGIQRACAHFGASPWQTVMIGDSWLDGAAAQRAAVPFIAFRAKPGRLQERGIPVWATANHLSEIPPILAAAWPRPAPSAVAVTACKL